MFHTILAVMSASIFGMTPTKVLATENIGLYAKVQPSIAWVTGTTSTPGHLKTGTAWVIDRGNRLLVTNDHVVRGTKELELFFPERKSGKLMTEYQWYLENGKPYRAKVILMDPTKDLAVLQAEQLPESAESLPLALSGPQTGDQVFTVGHPKKRPLWTPNSSMVDEIDRTFVFESFKGPVLGAGLKVGQGASGSPVVNAAGEVVGVLFIARVNEKTEIADRAWGVDVSEVRVILAAARKRVDKNEATARARDEDRAGHDMLRSKK